ncbi:type II toxin-antitoxin system VapC family toxin [Alteromonas lipotrueiana]|uniref:type II toxin-antitoxin system VapC family toxin n=1 Tax=Alteromonas lipotrueiana TaxID=2803815 RepID=UPI001C443A23|nr:PIN domain nuclease [Alteromonas lipotrueiana]
MILIDTSVWIDYFKGIETQETNLLDTVLSNDSVVIGDLILLEILQGFRSDKDYETAKEHLQVLPQFSMLSPEIAINAAENYRVLRKRGITIRKTADVIIATFCINKSIPLLFADKDFIPFTKHLKLQSVLTET